MSNEGKGATPPGSFGGGGASRPLCKEASGHHIQTWEFLTLRFLPRLSWLFALSFFLLLLGFESGTWKTLFCVLYSGVSQSKKGQWERAERPFCFHFMSCSPNEYRLSTTVKREGDIEILKIPSVFSPKHKLRKGQEENQNKFNAPFSTISGQRATQGDKF